MVFRSKKWVLGAGFIAVTLATVSSCGYFMHEKTEQSAQQIVETSHIADVLKFAKQGDLVIFDFDDTLVEPVYEFVSNKWFGAKVAKLQEKGIKREEAMVRVKKIVRLLPGYEIPVKTVEPSTLDVLRKLRQKKLDLMVLTARPFKDIKGTLKQAVSVGISFSDYTIYDKDIDFGDEAGFSKGIFCSGRIKKGVALGLFLDKIGYVPKRVIFVDDQERNIRRVKRELQKRKIPGVLILYKGASKKYEEFDFKRADEQLRQEFIKRGFDMSIYKQAS